MKPFFWKFALCILPCVFAAWVTIDSTRQYYHGDSGGFKLGVDLVGGTILVYEIDLRKNQESDKSFDPVRDINVLAESLKRRIDPTDLFNITIRPAGGEGRIEIILPTGGVHRAKKADDTWRKLLTDLEDKYLSFPYAFQSDTAATAPAQGKLKLDAADLAKVTALYISKTDTSEAQRTAYLKAAGQEKKKIKLRRLGDANAFAVFEVTGKSTENDTWLTLPIVRQDKGTISFSDGDQVSLLPFDRQLEVGRGKTLEAADRIQTIQSEQLWQQSLFATKGGWERMIDEAFFKRAGGLPHWAKIGNDLNKEAERMKGAGAGPLTRRFQAIKPGDTKAFEEFTINEMAKSPTPTTAKTIQHWFKKQAWNETMALIRGQWFKARAWEEKKEYEERSFVSYQDDTFMSTGKVDKDVPPGGNSKLWKLVPRFPDKNSYEESFKEDMDRITPDSVEQLTTFVLTRGAVIGQAALSLLNPLVGDHLQRVFDSGPGANEVRAFIRDHYGPPVQEILKSIHELGSVTGVKDASVEDVQRIKDLVSKVGSLEFRILANQHDDPKAIGDAIKMFKEAASNAEDGKAIGDAADRGKPPPAPRVKDQKNNKFKPNRYPIRTARSLESVVSYSWVELGPQERKALNLDNAARNDSTRNTAWHAARINRDNNVAAQLPVLAGTTETLLLQGALFYSRECKDRNLPEDERRKKEVEYFVLARDPEYESEDSEVQTPKIDGNFLTNAYSRQGDDLKPTVSFTFNQAGGDLFSKLTRKNVTEGSGPAHSLKHRHLAIILDGLVMSAPHISSEIHTQGQISGNFTQKEVDNLVNILRAGRLPATLKPQPVSESSIAATLGEDTINKGVKAIGYAFGAVLVFMIWYYRFAGLVASIALFANLLLTIGFMVAVQATFTLSGLAGIVLTLGMAVDANVLIYERLREERECGASLLQAIRNGYDRALPTIIDTHLSSIFTAIVLYVVGNDNLKGFAISMTVGLVISLFTSLFTTRVMFDFWQAQNWLTKLTMMRLFRRPDWDFMSVRYVFFGVSTALAVFGVALFVARIPGDLNIDFVGGTAYGGTLIKGMTVADLREKVEDKYQESILKGVKAKQLDVEGRRYELRFPKDSKVHYVSFNNVPKGVSTNEDRERQVEERASSLPEPSVELLFNSSDDPEILTEQNKGLSRNFMIRTTEMEPELVQICLDQLLREEDTALLKTIKMKAEPFDKLETRFQFKEEVRGTEVAATAAPSFVKSLFHRELRRAFHLTSDKDSPPLYELIGEGNSDKDGKYETLKITFGSDLRKEDFSKVETAIKNTQNALESRPVPDRLENFDSALATETRFRALWAILASWVVIMLYLWFRFGNWTFGLAAVLCLVHDVFFTLGAIAVCHYFHGGPLGSIGDALLLSDFKLDLAAVASLLTLVGYSVNDTIVVFDRIREVRGKNPDLTPKMINDSINQTLSRTVLASLTVLAVVAVLYVFGGPGVHLFAFIMVVGVIVGTYSSIWIASPLLLIFGEGSKEVSPALGTVGQVVGGVIGGS